MSSTYADVTALAWFLWQKGERTHGSGKGKGREMGLDKGNGGNKLKEKNLSLLNIVVECEIIQYNKMIEIEANKSNKMWKGENFWNWSSYANAVGKEAREQKKGRLLTPSLFYLFHWTENRNGKIKSSGSCVSFLSSETKRPEILTIQETAPLTL